jgi:hypothetical protein
VKPQVVSLVDEGQIAVADQRVDAELLIENSAE